MAIKKVSKEQENAAAAGVPRLMDNQDRKNKGDSDSVTKDKLITFWVTQEQRDEIKAYAKAHNMSVSRLIIEGLEMRMGKTKK